MKKFMISIVLIAVMCFFAGYSLADEIDVSADAAVNALAASSVEFPEPPEINEGKGYRSFAIPGEVNYPGMPGFYEKTTPGSQFQSATTLLRYKTVFTADELKKMAKCAYGSDIIVTPLVDKVDDKSNVVKMYLKQPKEAVLLGYITVRATSNGTVSMEILAEAALAARDLGGNAIHITAEGVDRVLKSFGWGIGLNFTNAQMSSNERSGSVASGGPGISGGSAGYKDRPWFQVFAIKVK